MHTRHTLAMLIAFLALVVGSTAWNSMGAPTEAATSGVSWTRTGDFPIGVGGNSIVAHANYLFSIGGYTGNGTTTIASVYRGTMDATGAVSWSPAPLSSLPGAYQGQGAATDGSHIFVVGGTRDGAITNKVLVATVSSVGLSGWAETIALPSGVHSPAIEIVGNHIYVMGGYNGSSKADVYFNRINPDGTLALNPWATTSALPGPRYWAASASIGRNIYFSGGQPAAGGTTDVWRAEADPATGALSAWTPIASLPAERVQHSMEALGNRLFVIAGSTSGNPPQMDTVFSVDTDGTGNTVGAWEQEPSPYGEAIHLNDNATVVGGRIYVVGGGYDASIRPAESNRTYVSGAIVGPPPAPSCGSQLAVLVGGINFPTWMGGRGPDQETLHSTRTWIETESDGAQGGFAKPLGVIDQLQFLGLEAEDIHYFSYRGGSSYTGQDTRDGVIKASDHLASQLDVLLDECPSSKITLVTHSLGGAVAAAWAGGSRFSESGAAVRGVVALAGPLGGGDSVPCLDAGLVFAFGGTSGLDLCRSDVRRQMRLGVTRLPFLLVNNQADWVTNGCISHGLTRADGRLNDSFQGAVWDSFVAFAATGCPASFLAPPCGPAILTLFGCIHAAIPAHSEPFTSEALAPTLQRAVNSTLVDDSIMAAEGTWTRSGCLASGAWPCGKIDRVMNSDSVSSRPGDRLSVRLNSAPSGVKVVFAGGTTTGNAIVSVCGFTQVVTTGRVIKDARIEFDLVPACTNADLNLTITVPVWFTFRGVSYGKQIAVDAVEVSY